MKDPYYHSGNMPRRVPFIITIITGPIITADAGTTVTGTDAITEEVIITDAITTPVITQGTTLSSEDFRFRFLLFPLFHSPAFN